MGIGTITIETKRLKLRKLTFNDVDAIFTHLKSDERVTDNLVKGVHLDVEETYAMVKEIIDEYDNLSFYSWGMEIIESGELIGLIDIYNLNSEESKCEVGYSIGYNWWNNGYGTEALEAVVNFAFNNLKVDIISATHNLDNPASGRIMEKVGMKKDCEIKNMITNSKGISKDCAIYSKKNNKLI